MSSDEPTKATLTAVARVAGVTVMTLSRYFRTPDKVAEATQERIARAIKELGYVPDASASRLAGKKRPVLVIIVPSLELPYVAELFESVAEASADYGAALMVMETQFDPSRQERKIEEALSWRPDGIVFVGDTLSNRSRHLITSNSSRFVEAWAAADDAIDINIGLSHRDAARQLAAAFVEAGYDRVAFAVRRLGYRVETDRVAGYRQAMAAHGRPEMILESSADASSYQNGSALFAQAWDAVPRPDVIFFAGDLLAVGALFEAHRRGIAVPGQIAVSGFGDYPIASEIDPALTTVRLPMRALGKAAVDACINGAGTSGLDEKIELIERASARLSP